jgi:hypothetical protein
MTIDGKFAAEEANTNPLRLYDREQKLGSGKDAKNIGIHLACAQFGQWEIVLLHACVLG